MKMCGICWEYGVQTVAIRLDGQEVESCFRCIEEAKSA